MADGGNGGYIDVQIVGDSRTVENALRGMEEAFDDRNMAFVFLGGMVDPYLRERIERRFAGEGDDVVGQWAPLAQSTIQMRQDQGFGGAHPINERTGVMKRHLLDAPPDTVPHSLGATMWSPGRAVSASTGRKIRTAQSGGTTPEGRFVPPRPVLGVGVQDLETVLVLLGQYMGRFQAPGARSTEFL